MSDLWWPETWELINDYRKGNRDPRSFSMDMRAERMAAYVIAAAESGDIDFKKYGLPLYIMSKYGNPVELPDETLFILISYFTEE